MPGLRDILDAATPDWEVREYPSRAGRIHSGDRILVADVYHGNDLALIALAPELAALCLDMGEQLRKWMDGFPHEVEDDDRALLARLDRIGKEPGDE